MWLHPDNAVIHLSQAESNRLGKYWHDTNVVPDACIYCATPLILLGDKTYDRSKSADHGSVHACSICGWWCVCIQTYTSTYEGGYRNMGRIGGTLVTLDATDISVPIQELSRYLVAKYSDRHVIPPRRFEEIVAGVFADFNYEVRLTSFSGDDGIDVIVLDGQSNDVVGVQVKRHRNRIEAEQIREFAGSLMLNNMTKGIYITTSKYRAGAIRTAAEFARCNLAITLWDADDFYDRLRLTRQPSVPSFNDETAPFIKFIENPETVPSIHSFSW